MGQKIKLDDKEYDMDNLSDQAKATISLLQFANTRLQELTGNLTMLQKAKQGYIGDLKKEIISTKAGYLFGDDIQGD